MAKTVRVIPATISRYTAAPINSRKKRRVAGYARVSTDHDDQVTSYAAQVDYYTNYIKERNDWEFVGIYTDEDISATNTRHRDGFKRMVRDAKGELLITIMSSLAQEESRSISENVTWGHRKRFADGKMSVPYRHFLGYDKGPDGNLAVNREQARTVKLIYHLFLDGDTFHSIVRELTARGLETPFSSKIKCGQCGGWYGAKVWHSTDKHRRTIYRCNGKFKSHCKTPHLTEDDIKEAFVRDANQLIENKADVLDSITLLKERLADTEALEEERDRLSTELNLLADKVQQLIAKNARVAQNQDDYDRNYNKLVSRYEAVKTQYDKTCEAIQYRKARSRQMDNFIQEVREQELIKEFDARLWGSLEDFITVYSKDDIRVTFKDGTEIRA